MKRLIYIYSRPQVRSEEYLTICIAFVVLKQLLGSMLLDIFVLNPCLAGLNTVTAFLPTHLI